MIGMHVQAHSGLMTHDSHRMHSLKFMVQELRIQRDWAHSSSHAGSYVVHELGLLVSLRYLHDKPTCDSTRTSPP